MLFNSLIFLFLFLPIVLFAHTLGKEKFRNNVLLIASLIFFAWGGVSYALLLIGSIIINYFFGLGIGNNIRKKKGKIYLLIGIGINVFILGTFKYANFIVENVNLVLQNWGIDAIGNPGIILPIGISFYTFQAMSYLIDVYRETTPKQKNVFHLALYIAAFPQLIAGPIVRYHDISKQIERRTINNEKFSKGVERFLIGLAKKVLIANNLAIVADAVFNIAPDNLSTLAAWIGLVAYSLQIYCDFSGYSEMAIGLGLMLGFNYLENFNLPYISKSIKEFWRRWHISLSYWFRDYLYISLGGNRKGKNRTYINLLIVFVLTGFWHGASWAFLFWGIFHGLFLIVERIGFGNTLEKSWKPLRHLYTVFIVLMGWVLFRAETFSYAKDFYISLFTYKSITINTELYKLFLSGEFISAMFIAILGASGFFLSLEKVLKKLRLTQFLLKRFALIFINTYDIVSIFFYLSIFFISVLYILSGSYSPFIYFRF